MTHTDPPGTFRLDAAAIANFVKLQRSIFGWKQDMLAAEAGVSLATVQRVERGRRVRDAQLRKLAVALRRPDDEFLRQRARASSVEVEANLAQMFAWTNGRVAVAVAPLRTEIQLRAMLGSFSLLVDSDLEPEADADVAELREWFDLASFVQAERQGVIGPKPGRELRVRTLWRDVLACADRIERTHRAVCLAGTYVAKTLAEGRPIDIALLAIRSRRRDPAVAKLTTLWAEQTVDDRQMLEDWCFGAS